VSSADAPVLTSVEGQLGRIRLNRPRALNALTLEMIQMIGLALDRFEADDGIRAVLLEGEGDRGFCAGGDIRALRDSALGDGDGARRFWREEYHLNARIARATRPVVAILDGIVMGGGIGLAGHAAHRVVTERVKAAMPEVGIGFYPDVGGTWLLARAPGRLGEHLALTGSSVGAADALLCGLADVHVPVGSLPGLIAALASGGDPATGLAAHAAVPPDPGQLPAARSWIDSAYGGASVAEILDVLDREGDDMAAATAAVIRTRSPTSLAVALHGVRAARAMESLEAVLDQDYRVSCGFLTTADFVEGIRAAVVDKDRNPGWNPAEIDAIGPADIERYFESLGADELGLSPASS
jgi:enoyl-CoA hydratase